MSHEIDPSELESSQAYHHKKPEPNGRICPRCKADRDYDEYTHNITDTCDTCFDKDVESGDIITCEGCDCFIWLDKALIVPVQDTPDDYTNIYLCKKCYKEETYERELED